MLKVSELSVNYGATRVVDKHVMVLPRIHDDKITSALLVIPALAI